MVNNINLNNMSMLSWAWAAFESNSPLTFQWTKKDLPDFVRLSLAEKQESSVASQWSCKNSPAFEDVANDYEYNSPASAVDNDYEYNRPTSAVDNDYEYDSPASAAFELTVPTDVSDEDFMDAESDAARTSISMSNNIGSLNYFTDTFSNESAVASNSLSNLGACVDSTAASSSNSVKSTPSSDDKIAKLIQAILKGDLLLDDICLSCRKEDALPIIPHPLFEGQICVTCSPDVRKVCDKLPLKERLGFCTICGKQPFSLVKCGYDTCHRAYCKTCVECLDSEDAYLRIVQNPKWSCYTSQAYSFRCGKSLIRQRKPVLHNNIIVDPVCNITMPINLEGDIRQMIRNGCILLEEVCISCHRNKYDLLEKLNISIVASHPLFFGTICELCKYAAEEACCQSTGERQYLCNICGRQRSLVHCSNEKCMRSYCKKCIDFFDSEAAYDEIKSLTSLQQPQQKDEQSKSWSCYYCKPSKNEQCLIIKRIPPDVFFYDFPPLEVYKAPPLSIGKIVKKLHKGEINLQDVCVACFKENIPHHIQHPLFRAVVCVKCSKDVMSACEILEPPELQNECVICGQGGELIYCCNNLCLRAYCKTCIKYLDGKRAYDEILKNENWYCYFCDLNPPEKCLLKRRGNKRIILKDFPTVPAIKNPIAVLASNDTGREVLKKLKIKVKKYRNFEEQDYMRMDNINLILGGYFVKDETKIKEKRYRMVQKFLESLLHFNNRRYCNLSMGEEVFFIFIGDYLIMDADILSKVANFFSYTSHFSSLVPVLFQFGERKFLAWSNLSACMPKSMEKGNTGPYVDKCEVVREHFINLKNVEEEIYYYFIKYLRAYFELE